LRWPPRPAAPRAGQHISFGTHTARSTWTAGRSRAGDDPSWPRSPRCPAASSTRHRQRELHQVYDTLGEQIGYQTVHADVSKPWFVLGTLVCLLAAGLAIGRSQRLPV